MSLLSIPSYARVILIVAAAISFWFGLTGGSKDVFELGRRNVRIALFSAAGIFLLLFWVSGKEKEIVAALPNAQLTATYSASVSTQTATPTNIATLTSTSTVMPTLTSTITPIPTLTFAATEFCTKHPNTGVPPPCKYKIVASDTAPEIARKIYGDFKYAGKIADLHRDEDGKNASFNTGDVIIIPALAAERTIEYLMYYLGYETCENNVMRPAEPCLYFSQGESYLQLALTIFRVERFEKDILEANAIKYISPIRVAPMELAVGLIVVIPAWP